ncbi:MAG: hypothetical protein WCY15_01030 [Phenylobacterium sp.]|jgi:hypothetical protein|uniref:hypothetical protein n=1 Tax=Phenylobacterium sp. TaxID=1871053 RepID=UPI002A3724A5|nr:hypothetical protein [Phenylobacterium sp.]MDX9997246.1 hypothetical protein [Phenylobacterium sp.]
MGIWSGAARACALLVLLAACDEPGPLSAAAKGRLPPPPEPPAWSSGLRDQVLREAFPGSFSCLGAVDLVTNRYLGGRKVVGWAWNRASGSPVARLIAVDEAERIVGFGMTGFPRPDVPQVVGEVRSDATGWEVVTWAPPRRAVRIYGVDTERRSACEIGSIAITP